MRALRRAVWVLVGLCLLPLLSVIVSTALAAMAGCELSESGTTSCFIAGLDFGGILSTLFAIGWMSLVTLPLIGIVLMAWAVLEAFAHWRRQRRARKSGNVQT